MKMGSTPEGWLPELWYNPFTRGLGLPPDLRERIALFDVPAQYSDTERTLSHDQRKYAALRLFDASSPLAQQVDYAERMHMMIRQGYKARNPAFGWHRNAFMASAAALATFTESRGAKGNQRTETLAPERVMSPEEAAQAVHDAYPKLTGAGPTGFALIGDPGMGKSTSTDRVLASIPEKLIPQTPYHVVQIPWLKIECPSRGGRRQFCIAAFDAIDKRLGTDYSRSFSHNSKVSADHMMLVLQHLATLHAIGVIVVDEIQHLLASTEGPKPLINFLVTFVNLLGVPVILIGTNEARPIIEGTFREARRASGLGQPNWERLRQDEEWEDWLAAMWRFQWTNVPSPLTPEISAALYAESQGIIDIAVKLLILGQFRAISNGEVAPGAPEILDAELFRQVARDEFALAQPMIRALREGRVDVLASIPDLMPLQQHIDGVLARSLAMPASEFKRLRELRAQIAEAEMTAATAHLASFKASLLQRGHTLEVVERVLAEAVSRNATDDLLGISETIANLLTAEPAPRAKPVKPKRMLNRNIPADGIMAALTGASDPAEALKAAGLSKSVAEIIGE